MHSAYQRRVALLAIVTLLAVLAFSGPAHAEVLWDDAYPSVSYGGTDDVFQTVSYHEMGAQDVVQESIVPKDDLDLGCSKCAGGTGCYCGPKWGVRAGALALFRARPDSAVMFSEALPATTTLNAAEYDFGYKPGLDLSVMRKFDGLPDIEFRYMGSDAWTARAGLTVATRLNIGAAVVPILSTPNSTVNSAYGSELGSFELNLRASRGGCVTWLLGFRYIELDEAYRAVMTPVTTTLYSIDTRNRLYGAQVGAEVVLLELDRLKLDFVGKAGIFGNSAGQNSTVGTTAFTSTAFGTSDRAAFVGEAHVAVNFCLVGNLSARVSYGVMGVTDVALASDQVAASSFLPAGTGLNNNGNAFYHGGFVGLDFAY